MRTRLVYACVCVAVVLTLAAAARGYAASVSAPRTYAPGVVLVGLKPGADVRSLIGQSPAGQVATGLVAASQIEPVFPFVRQASGLRAQSDASAALSRIYRLRLPDDADVSATVAALAAHPDVEFAEPDYVMQATDVQRINGWGGSYPFIRFLSAAAAPNDPLLGDQWGLTKISASGAWDVTTGISTTVVAIVDSGLDTAHEDFAGQVWANPLETPGNGVDDDGNGLIDDVNGWNLVDGNNNLADDNGHGTQVAGVAGAATNNGKGIAGMCWNCRLMIVKVMQTSGAVNYSDVAAGVAYAAGQGAQVINLSLGGYADAATLRTAIESAAQTAVIVAGAGNDNKSSLFYPAAYPDVIAAAATDSTDAKASFSNYGSWVDVAAPGVAITTTFAGSNSYGNENGTSMSAPFVAGLAGLIRSKHPDWSPALVRQHIVNTAANIDSLNPTYAGQLGGGRINAQAALTTDAQPQMSITGWTVDGQSGGQPEPGKTFSLTATLNNTWKPARSVVGTLSESDPYATVVDATGAFGDINTGQSKSNTVDVFQISLQSSTPYNHPIPFTLSLAGADGYALTLPFTLTVRSGFEYLGNTIYTTDKVWTSDKTYIISGTVIVNPGVTLTIQPGTVVKGNATKFLRIDGTLIASGTASSPIVFGYNTGTISLTTWSGIRFTDSSVSASLDADGNYVSGSILRYVDFSSADTAVNMGTRSPYIADSVFRQNGTALQIGSSNNGGSPRIERNTFTGNTTPIGLNGGQPYIAQNTLTGNGGGVSGSGSPMIISNTFTSNAGAAIGLSCCNSNSPIIRDNRIVDNSGPAINVSGLQVVEIEHNLIANNRGSCGMGTGAAVCLDVQSSSGAQYNPALVYNPDRDEYLLVWGEWVSSYYQVRAMRVLSEGQPIGTIVPVSIAATNMITMIPGVAYNPAQREYLVAWTDGTSGRGVLAQRMSGTGSLLGSSIAVTNTPTGGNIRVVHQSADSSYLVVWQDTSASPNRLYARRVMTDGTLLGDILAIAPEVSDVVLGDVAYDPSNNRSLVTLRGNSYTTGTLMTWCYGCVHGVWVSPASPPTVSAFVMVHDPQNAYLSNPAVAFAADVGRYFTAWERGWAGIIIQGQAFLADGTAPVSQTMVYSTTDEAHAPRVAYAPSNGQFLTVLYHSSAGGVSSIYGQRVYTDGTLAGSPIAISTPGPNGRNSPVLAYNSLHNEYLIAWVDDRYETGVIYGQRVSADGQLLDNAWTTADETDPAVNFRMIESSGVRYNTIIGNSGYGVQLGGYAADSVLLAHNNWFGNGTYDVYLSSGSPGTQNFTVTAESNYWGSTLPENIPNRIYDCTFDANSCNNPSAILGKVDYDPPLTSPNQTAPAFVRAASVSPEPLGLQRGTFDVTFSRPMVTTTLPSVIFHDARQGTISQFGSVTETVNAIAKDVSERMWFGSSGNCGGAKQYDGENWVTFNTGNSGLADNCVAAIFGSSSGDMWFGHWNPMGKPLSRLQGTTWITYTSQSTDGVLQSLGIGAVGQDATGRMWFGDAGGAVSFDGTTWRRYTTADGLADNNVSQIARDGQGRMWFKTNQGLSVFDGISWTTYDQSNGLPAGMYINALFGDSQGRIWIGYHDMANWSNTNYVAMVSSNTWTFYGRSNTSGALDNGVSAFAEHSNGSIWALTGGSFIAVFDGVQWTRRSEVSSASSPMLLDARGNLWMGGSGLRVLWGGEDYPVVDNGQWISSTLYRATYLVTPIIPKGTYALQASNAAGLDGMAIVPYAGYTFIIDYAGGVSDGTPPTKPVVSASNDGTLTTLSFSWTSTDPESGIDQYKYAIGTTPGGRDVLDWTYVPKTTTSVKLMSLLLTRGQSYYVTVAARNTRGLWSQNGVSSAVVAGVEWHYVYLPLVMRNP